MAAQKQAPAITTNGNKRRGRPPRSNGHSNGSNGTDAPLSPEEVQEAARGFMGAQADIYADIGATEPTMAERELMAMRMVKQAIERLSEVSQVRVLRWALEAHGLE